MRLKITESKNAKSLYVIRSTYENGKHSSKIVEKLGTYAALSEKLNGEDPILWAKRYIDELNRKEKQAHQEILVKYAPAKRLKKDEQHVCLWPSPPGKTAGHTLLSHPRSPIAAVQSDNIPAVPGAHTAG